MSTTAKEMDNFDDVLDDIVREVQDMDVVSRQSSSQPAITKTSLVKPDEHVFKHLLGTLESLLKENEGDCIYTIGTGDGEPSGLSEEDLAASVKTLEELSNSCDADVSLLRTHDEEAGKVAEYLVRRRCAPDQFSEVRVAVVGNVDAGKSTLLGVLTHNVLDNGRGLSRQKLFRHQHEMESGRTSSVSYNILGYDSKGAIVNKPGHDGRLDWVQICTEASKVTTFIDLAGHERYLKTTVFGLTGHAPHYTMLMIGSNAGIVGMTKEHLGLSLALHVPLYVVVTKIDMCPPNVLEATMKLLQKILKSAGCKKIPMLINNMDDVVVAATNFVTTRICPIFQVSNVTGENLDLLKAFINLLKPPVLDADDKPAEFQIDDTFSVPGVGTVVSGYLRQGVIRLNDTLMLGPDALGHYQATVIKGIHRRRMPTTEVRAGQTSSFALKKVKRSAIRKGMMLLGKDAEATATWEFEGEILVLHHPTTITARYQAMVHCGSIRQTATIVKMDKEHIRTGDKAVASFRFIRHPEYIKVGEKIVFREGRTKAIGTITKLL
ncbi:GTP-binding protein 1 [Salpingoeca rosetta]|uniref:GTP-binding protein 1 n=1 Tax=Salpingoeca rosetta (strain ATCC 50818 / BSB-021) TaxID=946362 RepID=F2U689_SALR5|nr:GTP-binding protein 1 [Salpingoeca rosetta]EGD83030.1 GTP-binding protein 1 [Salpingoeca rosetta]|eukprot:XP_004995394.1 GTP-binding protein 1 [Salpingoeca rosetta]